MSDSKPEKSPETSPEESVRSQDDLDKLRDLILGPFQTQLDELQRRLDTPHLRAKDVSSVLPEAISLRSSEDKKIEIALEPITENAIRSSIKKDRQVMVDVLFPVMGPAIRKAIASTIQSMIQGFNKLLENSFSAKGLKWRLEALRTGRTFAEVVFLHTLDYQVEQLFLINGGSGIVLQHVVAKTVVSHDPDLVSGMLTAIKDFVQDSFGTEKEASLETLRIGNRNVWIEYGPHAFLAAVIQGDPPVNFQLTLREALEEIHFKHSDTLVDFGGDSSAFEKTKYILDNCLQAQLKAEKKRGFPFIWVVVALIFFLLLLWPVSAYHQHRKLTYLITALKKEPGIVVTSFDKVDGRHQIIGLRDPLAADPDKIIQQSGLDSESINARWELYHSSHPEFMIPRIKKIIKPPPSIHIRYENGVLRTTGSATAAWIQKTRKLMDALPWIEASPLGEVVDIENELKPPETVQLKLQGTTLIAFGEAPQQWIREMQAKALLLPGITDIGIGNLVSTDLVELEAAINRLQESVVFFKMGSNQLEPGELDKLPVIVEDIKKIVGKAQLLDLKFRIEIIGHADSSGSIENNLKISHARAEELISLFQKHGLARELFVPIGAGSEYALSNKSSQGAKALNRRVTLQMIKIEESP